MAAILYHNLADTSDIRAGTQVLDTPATNVLNEHVGRKWRSLVSSDNMIADFGALTSIDTVALVGLTATSHRVRLSTSDATGSAGDLYDSGSDPVDQSYLQAVHVLGAPVSARYLRIDLVNATGVYVELGRLVAGLRSVFTYNFAFGWERAYVDPSMRTKTSGGQTQIGRKTSYRTLMLPFEWVATADRHSFIEEIDRVNGLKDDVLFITDEDSADLPRDTVWGLVTDLTPVAQPYFDIFSKTYRIEERL